MLSSPVGIHGLLRNGGWKTKAFSGWTLNGTFTAHSGTPLTALISGNLANRGSASSASCAPKPPGSPSPAASIPIQPAAFDTPARRRIRRRRPRHHPRPASVSLNGSLNRAFRFGETRRQLQLRLTANNVLNHVQITGFGTTVNSSTYGLATAASGTRTVSLLLRFNF